MSIKIILKPRETMTKEQFMLSTPPYSIALDGMVKDVTFRYPLEMTKRQYFEEEISKKNTWALNFKEFEDTINFKFNEPISKDQFLEELLIQNPNIICHSNYKKEYFLLPATFREFYSLQKHIDPNTNQGLRDILRRIGLTENKFVSELLRQNPLLKIALSDFNPLHLNRILTPKANFNHHDGNDRLITRSTSGQIYIEKREGLFDIFNVGGAPFAYIFANDIDQDVTMAMYQINNASRQFNLREEKRLFRLIKHVDLLDTTGGVYLFDLHDPVLEEINWIFEPYKLARMSGKLYHMNAMEMSEHINEMCLRIEANISGNGGTVPIDTGYNEIASGTDWKMVEETGINARTKLFAEGVKLIISVRPITEDRNAVTFVKLTPYNKVDLPHICEFMNQFEHCREENSYGGGDFFLGTPREGGTSLPLEFFQGLAEAAMTNQLQSHLELLSTDLAFH